MIFLKDHLSFIQFNSLLNRIDMSFTLLSVSRIHIYLMFLSLIHFSNSQSNTINKACSAIGSTCGVGQACIGGVCECDPAYRRFWTGEKYQCRVCPPSYIRARNWKKNILCSKMFVYFFSLSNSVL